MSHRISRKVNRVLLCAGTFGLASMWLSSSASANLLTDPGFEEQIAAPNPNPTGTPGWANFGGAQFLQTPLAHSGSWVLYTPDNGGGYNVPGTYQTFAATPGQQFTFSGYVYTPNALVAQSNDFAILQMDFYAGSPPSNYATGTDYLTVGTDIGTPAGAAPAGLVSLPQGVWTAASVTATAPTGTNSMAVYLLDINADSSADFYFDDMDLEATSVPEPATLSLLGIVGVAALQRRRRSV
ncbi:MAG TPA: PEP-CTERM sorting domain-containing protein [Tepidisphaeraceae bacterium]|nr:PEP-CTERM sorting domain-containing protein [Tepidisphaeraceae bacterium]